MADPHAGGDHSYITRYLLPALREVLVEIPQGATVLVGVKSRFGEKDLTQDTISPGTILVLIRTRHATRRLVFGLFIDPRGHKTFSDLTRPDEMTLYEPSYTFFPLL